MDTDSFMVYIKTEDIYSDIAKYYELDKPLPKEKKQKSYWINQKWITWKSKDRDQNV